MKKIILFSLLFLSISVCAQDQTFKGNIILQTGESKTAPAMEYGKKLFFGYPSDNGDDLWIARYNIKADQSELRINIGDDQNDKLIIGRRYYSQQPPSFTSVLVVHPSEINSGRVGINKLDPSCALDVNGAIKGSQLDINGIIRAKEVKIEATGWADFVFDKTYKLPSLSEVENHIREHKHLPNIPTEAEVKENGVNIGEMQVLLLQKIEELTLYMINQDKRIEEQEKTIRDLKERLPE